MLVAGVSDDFMPMTLEELLAQIRTNPEAVCFADVMDVINTAYEYTPVKFRNGNLVNEAGENEGSCRLFAFAKLHGLTEQQTLHCFGDYYRVDVLGHPSVNDHQNIRHFMRSGWPGVLFDAMPLELKQGG